MASRTVSVCYRTKKTVKGDARPTMVAIRTGNRLWELELKEVDHERDFAMGKYVTSHRAVQPGEDISLFLPRHCKWRTVDAEEDVTKLEEKHMRSVGTEKKPVTEICTHVPDTFEGLQAGDQVVMALGAGDPLAAMLFAKGKKHGVQVWRTPPANLKRFRSDEDKSKDHLHLVEMFELRKVIFYEFRQPDMALVSVAVKLRLRMEAQAQRIAAGNRLLQWVKDQMYLFEGEEENLNQWIEERCEILKRDDPVYAALYEEEEKRNSEMEDAVKSTAAWKIFEPIEGIGPRIAAGILCIGDIRRFQVEPEKGPITDHERYRYEQYKINGPGNTFAGKMLNAAGITELTLEQHAHKIRRSKAMNKGAAKMMAYCGLHTMPGNGDSPDGNFYREFARHKTGQVGNWSTDLRQAFFQFGEQLNRKPGSEWGKKLLQFKQGFLEKHPNPITVDKKLTKIFRSLELFFRERAKVKLQPEDNKITSVEELTNWFEACCALITDNSAKLANEVAHWKMRVEKSQVEGKTVKLFTKGHILKMAKWRTLTRFCRWLFPQLVKVMGNKADESQQNEETAA